MAGPNLHGVLGRRVGTAEGFDYSPVLQEAGRAGEAWDAARLERFLADPEEMYPGLWMGGNGLRAAADRRAVVEFLQASR
jgi:cytochrome c